MRILAIYLHYWPDSTPYARILRTLLEHLAAAGHETAVFTAQPGYNGIRHPPRAWRETLHGVEVRRVRLLPVQMRWRAVRAVNWMFFLVRAVLHAVVGSRYDVIIANSHPPIVMGCALRMIRAFRHTPYIYHCQDLHPESAALAGDLRRGRLYRALLRWDAETCRGAHRVVVLSEDMVDSLVRRGLSVANVSVINNPPLAIDFTEPPALLPALKEATHAVRFLFAGNLGRFQGLERLIAAAHHVPDHVPFQLILMGEGDAKRALVAQAGDLLGRRINFVPHQTLETALAAIRVCDYGVVSLLADAYRFAYPSKSIMYLSAGCPLLVVVEPQSELARSVEQNGCGYVATSGSVDHIAEAITRAAAERGRWTPDRRRAIAQMSRQIFGERRMLAAWDNLLPPSATALQQVA